MTETTMRSGLYSYTVTVLTPREVAAETWATVRRELGVRVPRIRVERRRQTWEPRSRIAV